jgi:hypothetical protein
VDNQATSLSEQTVTVTTALGVQQVKCALTSLIVQVWLTVLMLMILAPALAQKLAAASIRDEASLVIIFNTLPG